MTRAFTPESGDDRGRSGRAALLTAADQIGRDDARRLLGHLRAAILDAEQGRREANGGACSAR
jgi:hypothetical protein